MSALETLLMRWWDALSDEASTIENSGQWSGKKDRLQTVAKEMHTVNMLLMAEQGDFTKMIKRIEKAEASAKQMKEMK